MMTRKDYERAASIVRAMSADVDAIDVAPLSVKESRLSRARAQGLAVWNAREAFVVLFSGDNPRFDAERFRVACAPKNA